MADICGLGGEWHTCGARLTSAAEDFGHCARAKPAAVPVPGSAAGIREAVSFAAAPAGAVALMSALLRTSSPGQEDSTISSNRTIDRFDPHGILTPGHGIRIRGLT
jgi:FAD/FMN-containing dehydrogenase